MALPRAHPPREASPRIGLPLALACYAAVALLAGAGLVAWLDPAFAADGAALAAWGNVATNAIPSLVLALLLLALTRRSLLSLGLALLPLYLLYYANAIKLDLLDTPVMPADFVLLGHLGDGGALLLHYLPAAALGAALAAAVAIAALLRWERPWQRLCGWRRALVGLGVLALGASLLGGATPWSHVYAAAQEADWREWSPAKSAEHSGLPATLLRYAWRTAFVLPEPDRALAQRFMQAHSGATASSAQAAASERPDIVVVQSESFFDPARLRGLEASQVLPEFRRVAAVSRHGDLWVPTYGGGTIRTEFEVLTGIAMRYFPDVQYPYFRLTATAVPSLASVLAERGYATIAVHPHERDFWNRAAALAHLGFAEFDGQETFGNAARVGWYIGDDALVDHVLQRLDAATSPAFVFAISMENHGPYAGFPNADAKDIAAQPVPPGASAAAAERLRGYLYHLSHADRALGRLADALRQRPRRTLLLFYGDHLPSLPRIYEGDGFDDGEGGPSQPVPWLLFDTAHPLDAPASETTASFYLPALLLAAAGIDDGGYFTALESARRLDRPGSSWTPRDDEALGAIMQLRQRGEAP
ncbi:LTA synthase family protein [Dokdonella sp.]|uniref:LTA synthase family protein n=1 Tax=Dokdonella sp. TaxID=2291710 RepID=UPI002F3ED25D